MSLNYCTKQCLGQARPNKTAVAPATNAPVGRLSGSPVCAANDGVVTFEAKTDELAKHYIRDFGAIRVFAKQSGGPIMLMIADNAALSLFNTYLS